MILIKNKLRIIQDFHSLKLEIVKGDLIKKVQKIEKQRIKRKCNSNSKIRMIILMKIMYVINNRRILRIKMSQYNQWQQKLKKQKKNNQNLQKNQYQIVKQVQNFHQYSPNQKPKIQEINNLVYTFFTIEKILKQRQEQGKNIKKQSEQQTITTITRDQQKQMKRSNSNLNTITNKIKSGEQQISFLNIKGFCVSNPKQHKKSRLFPYQIEQIKKQNNENQDKPSLKDQLKKQITIARQLKKKSIIKKQKKFNNSYWDFVFFINWTNRMQHTIEAISTYKACVGKGNNSILIKNTLKSRFWWNVIDNPDISDANFYWSQSRNMKILESLKKGPEETTQTERQKTNYSEGDEESYKTKPFIFQVPKQKPGKTKSYYLQKNGLRKLASKKDLQNSKDNYSVEIKIEKALNQFISPNLIRAHNHLQFNWNLSNKKALYYNLKTYYQACKEDPFEYIPVTFHVQNEGDKQWNNFLNYFNSRNQLLKQKKQLKQESMKEIKQIKQIKQQKYKKKREKNVWIIKPGQNSNRGCGIDVCDNIQGIKQIIKSKAVRANGKARTHIIQSYIMPFLYCKRKFDIRCYIVITSLNDIMKGYWYQQGYIRTSSKQFTLKNLSNRMIHLTNDAIQKKSQDYGKFENANKISFSDFQKYLDNTYPQCQYNFSTQIYPHMIQLASDAIRSTFLSLDANRRQYTFEIFGLDFMIDQNFKVWLIQVNTNPCLQLSSPLLARIIPTMVQNAFKIGLDPLFPPPKQWPKKKNPPPQIFDNNKFSLIFDSLEQSKKLKSMLSPTNLQNVIEIEQESQIQDEDEE